MDKVNYALIMCSKEYQELICSTLSKQDVLFTSAGSADEKSLYEFVKQNTSNLNNYDAVIVDLGSLKDNDEEIIEAIETIRFYDDKIRIIIFEGTRQNSYSLLHKCFLNGIYNLIVADSYISIRNNFEKCIQQGMSYKDALQFRSEDTVKRVEKKTVVAQKKTIIFSGTQNRIGVTHCTISAAYTLRNYGYIVAVVDCTGSTDYLNIMRSYELRMQEDFFSLDGIDFYIKPQFTECIPPDNAYNFILYDIGLQCRARLLNLSERSIYEAAEEKVIVCGSKPWELPYLSSTLADMDDEEKVSVKYLYNMTNSGMAQDIRKMMKKAGIDENRVFFMDRDAELFQSCNVMQEIFALEPIDKKRGFFGRKEKKR